MLCPDDDAESCARPHNAPPRSLPRLRRRRSARRRRDQEGRRDPANPVNLGTLGAKSGRSPTTASGSTRPARLTTPLLRTEPTGPVRAGGLERRHRGRAVAPAAVGAGPCTRTTRAPARCPPARSSCGSSTGNLHLCRECTPVRPAAYSSSRLLDTRELSRTEDVVARTNAARLTKGTHHEPNVAVSSDCVGVWCIGSGRVGPGCRYRPGRASRPISMVPRPTLAGDRRELGHECLPHLVPGRLRVPGKCWFIRL